MKILILCASITSAGGTERAIVNTVNMFQQLSDIDITVVSITEKSGNKPYYELKSHCQIFYLNEPFKASFKKIRWYGIVKRKLKKIFFDVKPNIVLSYGHNISIMLPFIRRKNIRYYACEHINFYSIPFLHRLIIRILYPFLDGLVVLSESAKRKMNGLNSNIYIIPNTLSFTSEKLAKLEAKRLIMIGRLSPEKGLERLVPIAKYLKKNYPDWSIFVYGDGEQKESLISLYRQNDILDYIILEGRVDNIKEKLLDSSILLMTSYTEALPMVILEAEACGVPTIAYSCEGTNELIRSGYNGFVVNSADDFISKLTLLIENIDVRKQMGENSFQDSQRYSFDAILKLWRRILN